MKIFYILLFSILLINVKAQSIISDCFNTDSIISIYYNQALYRAAVYDFYNTRFPDYNCYPNSLRTQKLFNALIGIYHSELPDVDSVFTHRKIFDYDLDKKQRIYMQAYDTTSWALTLESTKNYSGNE